MVRAGPGARGGAPNWGVRARAPLRLGLAGGGTDLSPYCDQYGGAVLNATIDRFAFAHIDANPEGRLAFRARDIGVEEVMDAMSPPTDGGELALHRAVYRHVCERWLGGDAPALTVSTTSDAPAGSGLGSSSALVVALIEAFRMALDLPLGPYDVARLAYHIERVELGLSGGRQDQYAAAFGGVNYIEFLADDRVLIICFTGQSRRSETIINEQVRGLSALDPSVLDGMHRLKQDATAMKEAVLEGDMRRVARVLMRSWEAKKMTASGIATPLVDQLFDLAMREGAWGGKVSGAGGGGFLMFCTDPENRYRLTAALNEAGGVASAVKFTLDGAEAWSVLR